MLNSIGTISGLLYYVDNIVTRYRSAGRRGWRGLWPTPRKKFAAASSAFAAAWRRSGNISCPNIEADGRASQVAEDTHRAISEIKRYARVRSGPSSRLTSTIIAEIPRACRETGAPMRGRVANTLLGMAIDPLTSASPSSAT